MSPSRSLNEDIQQHNARSDLGTAILAALADAGKDVNHLKPENLAPVDEFHIRGRQATLELAGAVGLDTTKQVLDVGSGVGDHFMNGIKRVAEENSEERSRATPF
jgi:hypothetical protein